MNAIFSRVSRFCTAQSLIPENAALVIGLSGGPDSVFLLHFLAHVQEEKRLTLIAAHLNHEWRIEAENDEQLCKELCQKLGIRLISKKMSELTLNLKFNGSKEEIGRKARRQFFETVAKEHNAHAIAVAHHADDQMETFFIRLIRGASLAGLAGMKPKDGLYIRPLLGIKKAEVLEYLHAHQILYAIDASNQSDEYLRNRIRNSVIPALKLSDERFDASFASTNEQLQQAEEFLQLLAKKTFEEISANNEIDIAKLLALHPILRTRVIIFWLRQAKVPFVPSQGLFDEMNRFLQKPSTGEHVFYGKWQVVKHHKLAQIKIK